MRASFSWLETLAPNIFDLSFYAVLLHDLGKCASGFQRNPKEWGYRHEILSVPFVQFLGFSKREKNLIALAVLSHHKTLDEIRDLLPARVSGLPLEFDERVKEIGENKEYLEKIIFPSLYTIEAYYFGGIEQSHIDIPNNWLTKIKDYDFQDLLNWYDKHFRNEREYLTFMRGLLNAADHLASAGETKIEILPDIMDRINLRITDLRPLQVCASNTEGNLLLRAPTGYGKTEAALLWANNNAYRNERGITSRIFYILPYKASINAMYQRILQLFSSPDLVGVLHSSSQFYLYSSTLGYRRLNSLYKKIYTPFKVTTPFQLMKAFFGVGFHEMLKTELSGSLLIFDEIHAYEPNVLGIVLAMLEELKRLNVKAMVMTATLPSFIESMFKDTLKFRELSVSSADADKFTRHRLNVIDGKIDSIKEIIDELRLYRKVKQYAKPALIACNSVDRAIQVYNALSEEYNVLLLHSRFTYGDRENKEKELLESMSKYDFVVSTQVIEVSLDISFSTILTEPAPLDALIQRFGRVNRHGWKKKKIEDVYVLTEGSKTDKKIYRDYSVVKETINLLKELDGKEMKESLIPELISAAYQSVSDKMIEKIGYYKKLAIDVFENVKPMMKGEGENTFYEMFNGTEVVPACYANKVYDLLEKGLGIEIYQYLIPIPMWFYHAEKDNFSRLSNSGAGKHVNVVELHYDTETGLVRRPIVNNFIE